MATISYSTYAPGYGPGGTGGSYVSYNGGAMISTSGSSSPAVSTPVVSSPTVSTPTAVNPNQSKIDSLLAQVKSIQSVIDTAKAAGVKSGEQIPQSISGVAPTVNPNQAKIDELTKQANQLSAIVAQASAGGYTGTGKDIQFDNSGNVIPVSQLPKDTKELDTTGLDNINLPDTTAYKTLSDYANSLATDLANKTAAYNNALQKQLDDSKAEKEALQKQMDALTAKAQSIIEQQDPTKSATYEQEKRIIQNKLDAAEAASLTTKKNFEDNQKLTDELGTLLTDIQTDLQATKDVTGLAAIRNPRIAKSTEQATARIGVIEAVMAARNGQINQANTLIDKAFQATQAARVDQLNYLNSVLNFVETQRDETGQKLISVDSEVKNNVKAQIAVLQTELNQSQATVESIKASMTDPDTAMAYAQAGVTLNDSPEVINQKLSQYAYQKEISEISKDMASKGYTALVSGSAPAGSEVVSITDSKGNVKSWYKKSKTPTPSSTDINTSLFNTFYPKVQEFAVNNKLTEYNWNYFRSQWIASGGSGSLFDSNFASYKPSTESGR